MNINDSVLRNSEKTVLALRQLYSESGYLPFRMGKFEEYDLYAGNKDFLVSDNVITFTDTDGKLMALKPDVTLSIIKNSVDNPSGIHKIYYNENVYRTSKGTGAFREMTQCGVECIGNVGSAEIADVLLLAARSMSLLPGKCTLALSDLDIIVRAIDEISPVAGSKADLYTAVSEKNINETDRICEGCACPERAELIKALISLNVNIKDAKTELTSLLKSVYPDLLEKLLDVISVLEKSEYADMFMTDFSITGDIHYYNGIVFRGFVRDVPVPVLSGGQYDNLMKRMKRHSHSIGFAVYTDELERLDFDGADDGDDDGYINIALPKGRLGEKVYSMFAMAGYECPSILENSRKLIFENPERKVRYFWVKPSDVAIYVERGAADIGVAGKDILLEYGPDVYELLDLGIGKCRMAVAAKEGFKDDTSDALRVATKFANIAKKYYHSKGRDIDIIHLNGSIEIAPILGLSDVIVDIVETGTTLRENNLRVFEEILPISARLVANKSSFRFRGERISAIAGGLKQIADKTE